MRSPWAPIAGLWLILFLTNAAAGSYLAAWLAIGSCGLAVLSAATERILNREQQLLHSTNLILAARVRGYERARR